MCRNLRDVVVARHRERSSVLKVYLWIIRAVVLAIGFLVMTKLGISIPWKSILELAK